MATVILTLGVVATLGALAQNQLGLFGDRQWPLPPAAKIKPDDKAFKVKLPDWADGPLAERHVRFWRDGEPTGMKVNHTRTVVERGGGAFKIQRGYFYFSLPQDEDPRPIHRSLSLTVPRPVKPVLWIAGGLFFVIGAFMTWRNAHARATLDRVGEKLHQVPAPWLITGVFVGALVVTLARLPDAMTYSDGCFSVKGVPYTDSQGWDELAVNLSEGRGFLGGFSAQRPLYPVMLGTLYFITGQSLLIAKILNAVWLALATAGVCAVGVLGGSRLAGLAAALTVLLGDDYTSFSKLLLTETSGVAFGAMALVALGMALEKPAWWRIITAGLLLACSNLANGFALMVLPAYGAVALVSWWLRLGMRQAFLKSAVLAATVALAWMPWLLRQHAVHGIWNLSTSSAVLMYATASPEHGQLSVASGSAWEAAGVPNEHGPKYRFYMERYSEDVKADPAAYIRAVLRGMETFADFWVFAGPDHFGVVLLTLAALSLAFLWKRRTWTALLAAGLTIALLFALKGKTAELLWPVGSLLVLLTCPRAKKPFWALIVVTVPFVALLAGMTGGNLGRRIWTACEWTMPLLLIVGFAGMMRMLAHGLDQILAKTSPKLQPVSHESDSAPHTGLHLSDHRLGFMGSFMGLLLLSHAVLGSALTTGMYLLSDKETPPPAISAEVRSKAWELAAAQYDFLKPLQSSDERFWLEPCQFGEYVCQIDAWEDEQHWARSFEVRPYTRTVAFAQAIATRGLIPTQLRQPPREIPRNTPLLLIGVRNHDPKAHLNHDVTMVEALGYIPIETNGPAWEKAVWIPFSREAHAIAQGK